MLTYLLITIHTKSRYKLRAFLSLNIGTKILSTIKYYIKIDTKLGLKRKLNLYTIKTITSTGKLGFAMNSHAVDFTHLNFRSCKYTHLMFSTIPDFPINVALAARQYSQEKLFLLIPC